MNTKHFPDRYAPFIDLAMEQIEHQSSNLINPGAFSSRGINPGKEDAVSEGFSPVDSSIGKIKHILINVFMGTHDHRDERKLRNAFNKIFTDLVMKLLRPYGLEENIDNELLLTVSVQDTSSYSPRQELVIGTDDIRHYVGDILKAIFTLSAITQEDQIIQQGGAEQSDTPKIPVLVLSALHKFGIDWALGHYLALQSSKPHETLIVESKKEDIIKELPEANDYTKAANIKVRYQSTDLQINDGNVVFVGEYTLIGRNSANKFGLDDEAFKAEFARIYRVDVAKIIIIGIEKGDQPINTLPNDEWADWAEDQQPFHRLDLFITAAGKDEYGRCRLLVGEPVFDHPLHFPMFEWTKKKIDEIVAFLQNQSNDFAIYRNPLPLTYVVPAPQMKKGQLMSLQADKKRIWFFTSYNNCLVQYTENKDDRYVWIPKYGGDYSNEKAGCDYSYGPSLTEDYRGRVDRSDPESKKYYYGGSWGELKKYDNQNEKIWKSLGFNVIKLTNYLPMALLGGGVECTTKVLYREK